MSIDLNIRVEFYLLINDPKTTTVSLVAVGNKAALTQSTTNICFKHDDNGRLQKYIFPSGYAVEYDQIILRYAPYALSNLYFIRDE